MYLPVYEIIWKNSHCILILSLRNTIYEENGVCSLWHVESFHIEKITWNIFTEIFFHPTRIEKAKIFYPITKFSFIDILLGLRIIIYVQDEIYLFTKSSDKANTWIIVRLFAVENLPAYFRRMELYKVYSNLKQKLMVTTILTVKINYRITKS